MSNSFLIRQYFKYRLSAKGIHAVHSPFVFDFFKNVLLDRRGFYCYAEIEKLRKELSDSDQTISIRDYGTGIGQYGSSPRRIADIAKHVCLPPKYAQLLFRIALHYQSLKILELGTSLGISTLYLASVSKDAQVITLEGDENIAGIAEKNFKLIGENNISLLKGTFETELLQALKGLSTVDLAYLDGNHRKEATLRYFKQILLHTHEKSIVALDDIHWSAEMNEAWNELIEFPQVTATIDLFRMGLIFFRKDLSKQHFVLRW